MAWCVLRGSWLDLFHSSLLPRAGDDSCGVAGLVRGADSRKCACALARSCMRIGELPCLVWSLIPRVPTTGKYTTDATIKRCMYPIHDTVRDHRRLPDRPILAKGIRKWCCIAFVLYARSRTQQLDQVQYVPSNLLESTVYMHVVDRRTTLVPTCIRSW